MGDSSSSPLLSPASEPNNHRPSSKRSNASSVSTETTPLLSRGDDARHDGDDRVASSIAASSLRSHQTPSERKRWGVRRWPIALGLVILSAIVLFTMGLGFATPAIARTYAKQALAVEPTSLSIDDFTRTGVRARVQATVQLDASRVKNPLVRNLGRAGAWVMREVESRQSEVRVYLPEYGNVLLGVALVPPIVLEVRNGYQNHLDFMTALAPGDVEGIRRVANDWIEGRLGQLRVEGRAKIDIKFGIIHLGSQIITESIAFQAHDIPAMPEFNITKLNFRDSDGLAGEGAVKVEASVQIRNDYPIHLTIPTLGFDILVPNCLPSDSPIMVARATTRALDIRPRRNVGVDINGVIRDLPDTLTTDCPNSDSSPLDLLLGGYIHGKDTTVYIRGSTSPSPDTPKWISELLSSVTLPFPFPGHTFDNLIKKFSLADVHFALPDPFAKPDSPEAQPRLSALVKAVIALPKEMNFAMNVSRVRADADVYYRHKKLGHLDLRKWQEATSTRSKASGSNPATLLVESVVKDAPLQITNDNLFTDVIRDLLLGGKPIVLGIKADVDVDVSTPLGGFIIKKIPAEGKVEVKPISGFGSFAPEVKALEILDTAKTMMALQAEINLNNPTEYSAHVPSINISILNNDTLLGHATARNVTVLRGLNENLTVEAVWNPWELSGEKGQEVGRELLSQYISGWNTTLTLRTHANSIPFQPALGKALSSMEINVPMPRLTAPSRPGHDNGSEEDGPHFIQDATMHLLTSTATFVLISPLPHSTLYMTHINASAFYNHTDLVGTILYDLPFAVPPGASQTPRLPVSWNIATVGYEAIRSALGGHLKLDAKATAGVKIGAFEVDVWFIGRGIGAKIRL